jgi:hypothetical protein
MGYNTANGRYADTVPVTLHESAARIASGNGSSVELGDRGVLRLLLDVTAASGTLPSLSVDVQTSYDGTTWRTVGGFTALATTGSERLSFAGCDRFVRASYAISGTTPSFTFSVSGEAV